MRRPRHFRRLDRTSITNLIDLQGLPAATVWRARRRGHSSTAAAALVAAHTFIALSLAAPCALAWRMWDDSAEATDAWKKVWGFDTGPRGRMGHSMVMHSNDTLVVLFGGRDNEVKRRHVPRTYEVARRNGSLEFISYNDKPVMECQEDAMSNSSATSNETCSLNVEVGLYYNDVWAYNLNCSRSGDGPCSGGGWSILHPGSRQGGCAYYRGTSVCTLPSERWGHGAAMFEDSTMLVYGGYSQLCHDYCDDLWSFDLRDNTWMQIEAAGSLSLDGPGKRWRYSVTFDGFSMLVFGGHRIWHGFASDNSEANSWSKTDEYPYGGYLDDLWEYTKQQLAADEPVPTSSAQYGNFTHLGKIRECYLDPGAAWADRNDMTCSLAWPRARAGHAAVWDSDLNGMWVHGGYSTYFPYLSTDGAGAGNGTAVGTSGDGFKPYADYPFFLDDMWFYNRTTGRWSELTFASTTNPASRMDHVLLKVDSLLVMFGGYSNNYHYDDTWLFNTSSSNWLEKTVFVHPLYPSNCTDDVSLIEAENCTRLTWPKYMERETYMPWDVLPWREQLYYYPDPGLGHTAYVFDTEAAAAAAYAANPLYHPSAGTPLAPYAASGPRQYVTPFVLQVNDTHSASLLERCTSVKGEPTRGTLLDGLWGRSNVSVLIPQPRRQAPGWDGCRDRADARHDLPWGLMWAHPKPRSGMRAVYSRHEKMILMYGGQGYDDFYLSTTSETRETSVLDEFWALGMQECPSNCSFNGDCRYGYCFCNSGFYGTDCSNTSCPGDYCYYDDTTHEQVCSHCCMAGWTHSDGEEYATGDQHTSKLQCSDSRPGESHGVCDGFGTCQCAPPFLGEDCSIRNCQNDCSLHGWCSVEFPVSRCMCDGGYYGDYCQYQECLNNCSYPHGSCNSTTGDCACNMMYNPYNNTRAWYAWAGEDCSWVVAFAAAPDVQPQWLWLMLAALVSLAATSWLPGTGD